MTFLHGSWIATPGPCLSSKRVGQPGDGRQPGRICDEQLFAKASVIRCALGGKAGQGFEGGDGTIYLAPSDYHRIHLPYAGTLTQTIASPGALSGKRHYRGVY